MIALKRALLIRRIRKDFRRTIMANEWPLATKIVKQFKQDEINKAFDILNENPKSVMSPFKELLFILNSKRKIGLPIFNDDFFRTR